MAVADGSSFRHLIIRGRTSSDSFTSPLSVRYSICLPNRNVDQHASRLLRSLQKIKDDSEQIASSRASAGLTRQFGIVIEVASSLGYRLNVDKLERRRSGIEVLNVRKVLKTLRGKEGIETRATVFVPYGKLGHLIKLVEEYAHEKTKKGMPCNQPLIGTIAGIRAAALDAFWTESEELPPPDEPRWWEAWLRTGITREEREYIETNFRNEATRLNIEILRPKLNLVENTVLLIKAKCTQLGGSIDLLNCLTELRKPQDLADFFADMPGIAQAPWVSEFLKRVTPPSLIANAVCLLDSGVNREHPLLNLGLAETDMYSYNEAAWGTADDVVRPHGTEMAGLALYGELTPHLANTEPIELRHRLESVKLFKQSNPHLPELYGAVTRECIALPETIAPGRRRVFSMQVTSASTGLGRPSSWSTTIDELAASVNEEVRDRRLIILSAGNIHLNRGDDYPNQNDISPIHDPAHAWNALTVGAFTDKDTPAEKEHDGWKIVARAGGLCPQSATTIPWKWQENWPIKPDFVMEGGNMVVEPTTQTPTYAHSLQLLTTRADFRAAPLTTTGDTSAAAALAARYAALIQADYPTLWPETVRAILVHACDWTTTMLANRSKWDVGRGEWKNITRRYGYGTPNLSTALRTLRNSVTLVAQSEIQPFMVEDSVAKTNELILHDLPWPREALLQNYDTDAEMRVTLSYFIEPNPGPRAANDKYQYACCGLRFDVRRNTEDETQFRARLNRELRDEDPDEEMVESDSKEWLFGSRFRARGSIHSDIWHGSAAQLSEKNHVAIYPVNGWWRLRKHLKRYHAKIRYALVVNIATPAKAIDLYTPIETQITTTIPRS